MTEFIIECFQCKTKFTKSLDGKIPMFNDVKKYGWVSVECPACGVFNKCAKIRNNSTILLTLEE